jgi:hypothetical protein
MHSSNQPPSSGDPSEPSGSKGPRSTTECADCGEEFPLRSPLLNRCPWCEAPHNGCGQRLADDHGTASQLAQERGRDPGVGRPGRGEIRWR